MSDPLLELSRLEGVPSAVAAAVAAVDALMRDRGPRGVPAEISARALLANARATAAMEGPQWEPGAIRLSTELLDLARLIRQQPARVLARAHLLIARGVLPDDRLGRVTADEPMRLTGVLELLRMPTHAPSLVVAAIAHAEVALLAAPGIGQGVLARAVEHMVLIHAGIDPRAVLLLAGGHAAMREDHAQWLGAYATGSVTGVRQWILYCAQVVTQGAELSPLARGHQVAEGTVEPEAL